MSRDDVKERHTELDGELTPFKKVMGERGKTHERNMNLTPVQKGKGQVPIMNEDSMTQSDSDPPKAPSRLMQTLKASAATGSNTEWVQSVQIKNRPKPRPVDQSAPLAAGPPPMKASKPTSKHSGENILELNR